MMKFENKEEEVFWKDIIIKMCNPTTHNGTKVVEYADYYLAILRERMPVERIPYSESFPRYKDKKES